jgi:hypothetical protein
VNPYVSATIAMCVIVAIALAATAYMAVYFNRRAKADLAAALEPLRQVVAGEAMLDDAVVTGRFTGHIAEGKVAQLPGGMGRVFHSLVIDGAGGEKWSWTVSRSKQSGGPDDFAFEGPPGQLPNLLRPLIQRLAADRTLAGAWMRVEYDPGPGYVRLTKPMRTRRDLPGEGAFRRYLEELVAIADANRAVQYRDT